MKKRLISVFVALVLVISCVVPCFVLSGSASALNLVYPVAGNYFNLPSYAQWRYTFGPGSNSGTTAGFTYTSEFSGYPYICFNNVPSSNRGNNWVFYLSGQFDSSYLMLPQKFTIYGSFYVSSSISYDVIGSSSSSYIKSLAFRCGDFYELCDIYFSNGFLFFSCDVSYDSTVAASLRNFDFVFTFRQTFHNLFSADNFSLLGYQCFVSTENVISIDNFYYRALNVNGFPQAPGVDSSVIPSNTFYNIETVNSPDFYSNTIWYSDYVTNVNDLNDPANLNRPLFVNFNSVSSRYNSGIRGITWMPKLDFDYSALGIVHFVMPIRYGWCDPCDIGVFYVLDSIQDGIMGSLGNFVPVPFDFNYFNVNSVMYDANAQSMYQAVDISGTQFVYSGTPGVAPLSQTYDGNVIVYNNDVNYTSSLSNFGVLSFDWDFANGLPVIYTSAFDSDVSSTNLRATIAFFNPIITFASPFDTYLSSFDFSNVGSIESDIAVILDVINRRIDSFVSADFADFSVDMLSYQSEIVSLLDSVYHQIAALMPDEQQSAGLSGTNSSLNTNSNQIFSIESGRITDFGMEWGQITTDYDVGSTVQAQLLPTFLFVRNIIDGAVSNMSYVYLIFVVPIFIGLLFAICSRVPNISHRIGDIVHRNKDGD